MKEKYLPIGTVVLLKGGHDPIMITSYCVYPKTDKAKLFDYGACIYPTGILDPDTVHAFNHNQIDEILYMGYETKESKELSNLLNNSINSFLLSLCFTSLLLCANIFISYKKKL